MRFVSVEDIRERFAGRSVALVGSAPSVLDNEPGFIDSHDIVVRVNNHKLSVAAGIRTDVHYSFYGRSIRCQRVELVRQGVTLCMCKCPNSQPIESKWHVENRKLEGIDFRNIYDWRAPFWFCDTFIPDDERFRAKFRLLGGHIPTTGFSAILDIMEMQPKRLYITGFDFFASGIHNVDEPWRQKNNGDPIGHVPEIERTWLARNASPFVYFDKRLLAIMIDERSRVECMA